MSLRIAGCRWLLPVLTSGRAPDHHTRWGGCPAPRPSGWHHGRPRPPRKITSRWHRRRSSAIAIRVALQRARRPAVSTAGAAAAAAAARDATDLPRDLLRRSELLRGAPRPLPHPSASWPTDAHGRATPIDTRAALHASDARVIMPLGRQILGLRMVDVPTARDVKKAYRRQSLELCDRKPALPAHCEPRAAGRVSHTHARAHAH